MERVRIPIKTYSKGIWEQIISHSLGWRWTRRALSEEAFMICHRRKSRIGVPYQEGVLLGNIASYFSPTKIIEVGTGTGYSTLCLSYNSITNFMDRESGSSMLIHTCDMSGVEQAKNNITYCFDSWKKSRPNGNAAAAKIDINYHEKTSTAMFRELCSNEKYREHLLGWQMFFIDGRLDPEDMQYMKKLASDEAVYVFDDFEGIEKGVVNAAACKDAGLFKLLVYPSPDSKIALGINHLHLVAQ